MLWLVYGDVRAKNASSLAGASVRTLLGSPQFRITALKDALKGGEVEVSGEYSPSKKSLE